MNPVFQRSYLSVLAVDQANQCGYHLSGWYFYNCLVSFYIIREVPVDGRSEQSDITSLVGSEPNYPVICSCGMGYRSKRCENY